MDLGALRSAAAALRVRMAGSAATGLAWPADGGPDTAITMSGNPGDMAADVIIAREAGAVAVDPDGQVWMNAGL